jgi:hypothetical protein
MSNQSPLPIQIDPALIPTTLDAVHLGLAILSLIFVIIIVVLAGRTSRGAAPSSAVTEPAQQPAPTPSLKQITPESALQLLSLLQQEARLVDFLQEDLKGFADADVGAAARVVHEGGRKVLAQYFSLEPVRTETEETRITLPAGFNAAEIRLTGNVVGEPPFTGTLLHRGWRVTDTRLPKLSAAHDAQIIAAAEIEL